jgi:hypothetical protein
MRIMGLVFTGIMAIGVVTVGIADPAFAAKKKRAAATPTSSASWERCEDLSIKRDAGPGAQGQGNPETSHIHRDFMAQCMAGKIPLGQ